MTRNMYLVSYQDTANKTHCALTRNKKQAIQAARVHQGQIHFMSVFAYNDGLRGAEGDYFSGWWDYPTFVTCATELKY